MSCGAVGKFAPVRVRVRYRSSINRKGSFMHRILVSISRAAALMVVGALAAQPVLADKPSWAGNGKNRNNGEHQQSGSGYFGERQQVIVRDYYVQDQRAGHCPPGLAKKNNGCMPPGQAKKWHKGHPLPRDVTYYDLPPQLVVQLGKPPAGHKYVRVASDILLIAVGTSMVVDAIADLGRM
jgi:Ni/Co efflux regulator RcnB